jgi:hypothetical protein
MFDMLDIVPSAAYCWSCIKLNVHYIFSSI